jgi:hypothetical protein
MILLFYPKASNFIHQLLHQITPKRQEFGNIYQKQQTAFQASKPSRLTAHERKCFHLLLSSSPQGILNSEALDLVAHGSDLAGELTGIVAGDASSNDGAANTTGTAEVHLAADVDVGNVLVLAEKREVEENGERLSVGSEDDKLRNTTVKGLGGLVGALLQLAGMLRRLNEIEKLLLELLIGKGPGSTLRHGERLNRGFRGGKVKMVWNQGSLRWLALRTEK